MKKSLVLMSIAALALVVAFSVVLSAAQKDASYSGTLVDSKCYLAHGATTNDHGSNKNCGTLCLKGGTPGGLLTSDKKFYPLLAPSTALAPYVGQEIRVSGTTGQRLDQCFQSGSQSERHLAGNQAEPIGLITQLRR